MGEDARSKLPPGTWPRPRSWNLGIATPNPARSIQVCFHISGPAPQRTPRGNTWTELLARASPDQGNSQGNGQVGAQRRVTMTAESTVKSQEPLLPCGPNLVTETAESRTGHYLPKSFQPGKESNARLRPAVYSSAPAQGQSQASGPLVSKPGTTLPSSSLRPDHGDIRPESSREDPALRKRHHLTWSRGGALEKG